MYTNSSLATTIAVNAIQVGNIVCVGGSITPLVSGVGLTAFSIENVKSMIPSFAFPLGSYPGNVCEGTATNGTNNITVALNTQTANVSFDFNFTFVAET